MVIVINCCIKSLLSVLMLHISKVANATADGGDTKSHKVLVWLHIQLKIQRSEHTGGLKEMMSKVEVEKPMRTSMLLIPSPAWCPLIASFGSMGGGFKGAFIDSSGSAGGF